MEPTLLGSLFPRGKFFEIERAQLPPRCAAVSATLIRPHAGVEATTRWHSVAARSQSRVYRGGGARHGIFAAQFRFPPCLITMPGGGPGDSEVVRGATGTTDREPWTWNGNENGVRGQGGVADSRGGVARAAAIASLGPSFVRGCRGTSVFLFQRRR